MSEPSNLPSPRLPASTVAELIRIARQYGLSELAAQEGEHRVEIRLATAGEALAAPMPAAQAETAAVIPALEVRSPMTGVFYTARSPGEPPIVRAGDLVREGDVIGLIEAMKVFSEIPSDVAGRVRRIVARNGQLVREGEPLLELTPLDHTEA